MPVIFQNKIHNIFYKCSCKKYEVKLKKIHNTTDNMEHNKITNMFRSILSIINIINEEGLQVLVLG